MNSARVDRGEDPSPPPLTAYCRDDEILKSTDYSPTLIALHGLCGGSYWEACIVISRGCAMTKATSGILCNPRLTWDVWRTVRVLLRENFPNRPLHAAGFALGANISTNASVVSVDPGRELSE